MNEKKSLYVVDDHRSLRQLCSKRLNNIYYSWTAWPLKMCPIGCPRTSATDYQTTLPDMPDEGRSLSPRIVRCLQTTRRWARHHAPTCLCKFEGFDVPKLPGALGWNGSAQRRYFQENLVKQDSSYLKPLKGSRCAAVDSHSEYYEHEHKKSEATLVKRA